MREPAILELSMGDGSFMTGATMTRTVKPQMEDDPYTGGGHLVRGIALGHRWSLDGVELEITMTEGMDIFRTRGSESRRLTFPALVVTTCMSGWTKPNITSMYTRCHERRRLT